MVLKLMVNVLILLFECGLSLIVKLLFLICFVFDDKVCMGCRMLVMMSDDRRSVSVFVVVVVVMLV